jgi:hypothetical protein
MCVYCHAQEREQGNGGVRILIGIGRRYGVRTRLSQIATVPGLHLRRTCVSVFCVIWWKRKDRIASDSAFGTPTMRRVKPVDELAKSDFVSLARVVSHRG